MSNDEVIGLNGQPLRSSSPDASTHMEGRDAEEVQSLRVSQPLPQPKIFNGKSARTFKSFLRSYEKWADSMWGPNVNDKWTSGLDALLEGPPSEFYTSYVNQNLDYDTITKKLSDTFVGDFDPFNMKKLLAIQEMEKSPDESWVIFITRLHNIIGELYATSSDEEKDNRLREHLLSKLDAKTRVDMLKSLQIQQDYSPDAIVKAIKNLDNIPTHAFGINRLESINLLK